MSLLSTTTGRRAAGFICQPCRRALLAGHHSPSQPPPPSLQPSSWPSPLPLVPRRQASKRVWPVSTTKGVKQDKSGTKRVDPETARFTIQDVPDPEYWEHHCRTPFFRIDMSADELYDTALRYAQVAITNEPGWRNQLRPAAPLPFVVLHYVATTIILAPPAQRPAARELATHILHTLILRDYEPSILTMILFARTRKQLYGNPTSARALQALERLLAQPSRAATISPDAATVAGLVVYDRSEAWRQDQERQQDEAQRLRQPIARPDLKKFRRDQALALSWLRWAAKRAGGSSWSDNKPGAWDLQSSCYRTMARILDTAANTGFGISSSGLAGPGESFSYSEDEARTEAGELWKFLYLEMDTPAGYYEYAMRLKAGEGEQGGAETEGADGQKDALQLCEELLGKAAVNGYAPALEALSEMYLERLAQAEAGGSTMSETDINHLHVIGSEWTMLAKAAAASSSETPKKEKQQ